MILSHACIYGIQTLVYTAMQGSSAYVSTRRAAVEMGIPFQFISKVMQILSEKKLVISRRGTSGGIMLAREAGEISLLDIIEAIDGLSLFQECILGLPGCGHATPCPLHEEWATEREKLREYFKSTSLADVVAGIRVFSHRISIEEFSDKILHIS